MKNIILFLVKESNLHMFKAFDPKNFFDEYKTYKSLIVSEKLSSEETYNFYINDEGFCKIPKQSKGDFFETLRSGVSSEETITDFLGVDINLFASRRADDNMHLFAFYETDIEEYQNTPDLFYLMSKSINKNKKDNQIGFGDVIGSRIYKEEKSPITYLANIPKTLSLFIEIHDGLLTYFGSNNISAEEIKKVK